MVGGIHESALRAGGFRQRVVRPDSKQIFFNCIWFYSPKRMPALFRGLNQPVSIR
jgi:hypothetical protein